MTTLSNQKEENKHWIDTNILDVSLNDRISYQDFFRALGYGDRETVYLRTFNDKNRSENGENKEVTLSRFDSILPYLRNQNAHDRGIFFVVNGGGQSDLKVKTARAQFIDFDDFPFEEQLRRINEFPLEPSAIVKTKKSLHCYWILDRGDKKYFREVQERLIQYFGSDKSIKNESRVMRLYGFEHRKTETPVMVTLIKFDPNLKYTQRQFHEVLPLLTAPAKASPATITKSAETVPAGQRHYFVVRKIGEYLDRLKDSATDESILALVETECRQRFETFDGIDWNDFRKKYKQTIEKLRARHEAEQADPDFYRYALKAWKEENPGKDFDRDVVSWDEVREAGRRAADRKEEPEKRTYTNQITTDPEEPKTREASQLKVEAEQRGITVEQLETVNDNLGSSAADFMDNLWTSQVDVMSKYKDRKTGFRNLDEKAPFYPGVYLINAGTSMGKTSFCIQWADQLAQAGETVLYYSLEMSAFDLVSKSIARESALAADVVFSHNGKYNACAMRTGFNDDVVNRAKSHYKTYSKNLYYIDCAFGWTINMIMASVDKHIEKLGVTPVIFIDYLQTIRPANERMSDLRMIDYAVQTIKAKEMELKKAGKPITFVVISSISREKYTQEASIDAGKGSGGLEYTADVVLGLDLSIQATADYRKTVKDAAKKRMIKKAKKQSPRRIMIEVSKTRFRAPDYYVGFMYYPDNELFMIDKTFDKFLQRQDEIYERWLDEKNVSKDATATEPTKGFLPLGTVPGSKRDQDRRRFRAALDRALKIAKEQDTTVSESMLAELLSISKRQVRNKAREYGGVTIKENGEIIVDGSEIDTTEITIDPTEK